MTDFERMCREAEDIDWETRVAIVKGKSGEILPSLESFESGGMKGSEIFSSFLLASASADGRLAEEEYNLLKPLLESLLGSSVNYEDARRAVKGMKKESRELRKLTEDMITLISSFSSELKKDIVMVAMIICAVDGKVSLSEKLWVRRLLF